MSWLSVMARPAVRAGTKHKQSVSVVTQQMCINYAVAGAILAGHLSDVQYVQTIA